MNDVSLKKLFINISENAYRKVSYIIYPIRTSKELSTDIHKKIKENAKKIDEIYDTFNAQKLLEILNAYQIKCLLTDCLISLIMSELIDKKNRKTLIADNCINYCLEMIEKSSLGLSDENIKTIKNFLEQLFETKKLLTEAISTLKSNGTLDQFLQQFLEDKFIKLDLYEKSVQRIENELAVNFMCENKQYENIKNTYMRAMKQIYQMGFIYFVGEFKFNDFYIPPVLFLGHNFDKKLIKSFFLMETKEEYKKARENWKYIFLNRDIIYVIGGAGYGKSLFLRNIINNYVKIKHENIQHFLLIYCDLKAFYSNGNASTKTVLDFLQESMITITGVSNITQDFLQYFLNQGRCIILLDALDEVPKEVRYELHKKMIGYFSTCNPNNKICITSRDRGFIPQKNIEVFHICPLTHYDIDEYLDKMIILKKFKKEDKSTFLQQAQVLIDKEFLNNFLVLSLLVNIYKAERELPENKIDLYKKCFDYIAKKREEEKSKIGYNWNNIYPLMKDSTFISLSTLAAPNNSDIDRADVESLLKEQYKTKYSNEAEAECAIKEFLEFCSNRTELFVPSAVDDKFKFFHRSFFEYFYARYIYQQTSVEKMYNLMTKFDIDSELFELTVALVKEDNEIKYQELLEFIFEEITRDFSSACPNFTAFGILTLAMQVIDDKYYIDKFYKIILTYPHMMKNKQVSIMNQRLLQMWVQKGVNGNTERKKEFKEIYETYCIRFILNAFSRLKKELIFKERFIFDTERYEKNGMWERTLMERNESSIPFFVLAYQNYFDIKKAIETLNEGSFKSLLNDQLVLTKQEKRQLKIGWQIYNTSSEKSRKNFFQLILNRV